MELQQTILQDKPGKEKLLEVVLITHHAWDQLISSPVSCLIIDHLFYQLPNHSCHFVHLFSWPSLWLYLSNWPFHSCVAVDHLILTCLTWLPRLSSLLATYRATLRASYFHSISGCATRTAVATWKADVPLGRWLCHSDNSHATLTTVVLHERQSCDIDGNCATTIRSLVSLSTHICQQGKPY